MTAWTPEIDEKKQRATVAIEIHRCPVCSSLMIQPTRKQTEEDYEVSLFPFYYEDKLEAQLKRGQIKFGSRFKDKNDVEICEDCAHEGKATFICALCNQERTSDLKQKSYGDTPEFLCKICYQTQTAEVWERKEEELLRAHRYDSE